MNCLQYENEYDFSNCMIFLDHMGWTPSSALISAALVAVLVVYFVIALFVYVAYKEEKRGAELQQTLKKRE